MLDCRFVSPHPGHVRPTYVQHVKRFGHPHLAEESTRRAETRPKSIEIMALRPYVADVVDEHPAESAAHTRV